MSTNPFQKATKQQLKARVAFDGPTGAGKTWTALEWASVLAGSDGRACLIDTEHESARYYADRFDFDWFGFDPPYDPARLAKLIRQAAEHDYRVCVVDSLSHFWEGEGGTLDIVDAAAQKAKGNTFAGWKVGTPALRFLVDTILAVDMHVIATMRSKMEYVLETDSKGRQVPRKVGMAPVMRAGIEYEFTVMGELDLDHRLTFSKSRCPLLADKLVQPGHAADAAETFLGWLSDGEAAPPAALPVDPNLSDEERAVDLGWESLTGMQAAFREAREWVKGNVPEGEPRDGLRQIWDGRAWVGPEVVERFRGEAERVAQLG